MFTVYATADEDGEESAGKPRTALALLEAQGSNLFLLGINRYIRDADYAYISGDSIRSNLNAPWVWDQDEFSVNHIGHPYQGSFYFTSARSSGLPFYEAAGVAAFGSLTWELFMETETPSINDLVATTLGGAAVGEMLHRLYHEADASGSPLKWIISPMDGINGALFGVRGSRTDYSEFYPGESFAAAGIMAVDPSLDKERNDTEGIRGLMGLFQGALAYGDPYIPSATPFSQFEQLLRIDVSQDFYSMAFFSNGILRAFQLAEQPDFAAVLAISLHYDFIFSSMVNFSSNALGISLKGTADLPGEWRLQGRMHGNWIVLGASEHVSLRYGDGVPPNDGIERRDYDLGSGAGLKINASLGHDRIGSIHGRYAYYALTTIPASIPEYGSAGSSLISVLDLEFERQIRFGLFSGLSFTTYRKIGSYAEAPDLDEDLRTVNFYIKKKF